MSPLPRFPRVLSFAVVALALAACPSNKPKPAGEGEGEGEGAQAAEGEGEGEGGAGPCGDLSSAGACTSTTSGAFCSDGTRIDFDCTSTRDDAVCFTVNASYGVDCGVPTDSVCFDDVAGALPCADSGFACVITSSTRGQCQVNGTGCSAAGSCANNQFAEACLGGPSSGEGEGEGEGEGAGSADGQPTLVDCASFGATCVDGAGCLRDFGAACTPGLTLCGTTVDDAVPCPGSSKCPPPPAGEGEGEGSAGEGEGEGGQ